MRLELSKRIFLNFVVVIAGFCILGALIGACLIHRNILTEAQRRVRLDPRRPGADLEAARQNLGFDFLSLTDSWPIARGRSGTIC
jgi:hypothetical protein